MTIPHTHPNLFVLLFLLGHIRRHMLLAKTQSQKGSIAQGALTRMGAGDVISCNQRDTHPNPTYQTIIRKNMYIQHESSIIIESLVMFLIIYLIKIKIRINRQINHDFILLYFELIDEC